MRWALLLLGVFVTCHWSLGKGSQGQDLASIERKIAKEPEYQSGAPKYCLMVFGEKMSKRVWLVIDGEVLYADLNGNGDLTEEGEKIAKMTYGDYTPPDGTRQFIVNEVRDGDLVHRELYVTVEPVGRLASVATDFKKLLESDPKANSYRVGVQLQVPGKRGIGIEGRKMCVAQVDERGALQFSAKPGDAPVIQFGGKLKLGLYGMHELVVGRSKEVCLGIGTPGIGPGTMGWMDYNEIPLRTPTMVTATFPHAAGDMGVVEKFV